MVHLEVRDGGKKVSHNGTIFICCVTAVMASNLFDLIDRVTSRSSVTAILKIMNSQFVWR